MVVPLVNVRASTRCSRRGSRSALNSPVPWPITTGWITNLYSSISPSRINASTNVAPWARMTPGAVTNRLLPGQRPFLRRVANAEKPYRERDGSKLRTSSRGQALRHLRLGQPYRSRFGSDWDQRSTCCYVRFGGRLAGQVGGGWFRVWLLPLPWRSHCMVGRHMDGAKRRESGGVR